MIFNIRALIMVFLMIFAVISDLNTRKIPNRITVPFVVIGLGFNIIVDFPNGLFYGLIGFFVGFFIFLVPYSLKTMGAGDVKLMAALGSLTGLRTILFIVLFSALSGGVITIVSNARSGSLLRTLKRMSLLIRFYIWSMLYRLCPLPTIENCKEKYRLELSSEKSEYIPYAIAIAVGCALTLVISRLEVIHGLSI